MIAIKLKRTDEADISDWQRQFGDVVRFSYNRYFDNGGNIDDAQVRKMAHEMHHVDLLDATMISDACYRAKTMYNISKAYGKTVLFGGKSNWNRYNRHLISKEVFNANRAMPICVRGAKNSRGNRKFALDLNNDTIIFKPSKSAHFEIKFSSIGASRRALLAEMQRRYDSREEICFGVELNGDFITLIIDENDYAINDVKHIDGRHASIDMNPNYVALVVLDKDGTSLAEEIYDLKELNDLDSKKKYASKQDKQRWRSHLNNKRKHETLEISKRIALRCAHYGVSDFAIEDLNIRSKNAGKGRSFNKLCFNAWMRRLLCNNLRKRMNLMKIRFHEVFAGYSSIKGQLEHSEKIDSIAAAMEIATRIDKNTKEFQNRKVDISALSNRWKEEIAYLLPDGRNPVWKDVSAYLKKAYPGNSYRTLFSEEHQLLRVSERMSSVKSHVKLHRFNTRQKNPTPLISKQENLYCRTKIRNEF